MSTPQEKSTYKLSINGKVTDHAFSSIDEITQFVTNDLLGLIISEKTKHIIIPGIELTISKEENPL